MDYLILILLAACLLIMLVIHQDIIQFGEGYNRAMGQLLPRLASVGQPMKNALTLSCVIFFGGAIARTFTEDDRWLWNALIFSVIPPLVQFLRRKRTKTSG
tara:strand:+ start:319 stop:621 length:303 start_codon:yes stop_codon:yes gene_type:complete